MENFPLYKMAASDPNDAAEARTEMAKAKEILSDKSKLSEALTKIAGNKEDVGAAMGKLRKNSQFTRWSNRMAAERSDDVKQQVETMSYKQKKRLKLQAERINAGELTPPKKPTVAEGGAAVVSITSTRRYKAVVLEAEFQAKDFYSGWKCSPLELGEGLAIFYNPDGRTKNRLASRIRGAPTSNDALVLKFNSDGSGALLPLSVEELERAYPLSK